MNFVGNAAKAAEEDFKAAAASIDVPYEAFRAVTRVEAAGSGFDADHRPKALFERHIFYKFLKDKPDLQQQAVDEKLAYPKWGMLPYPKGSDAVYEEIERACKIDEDAALQSTSWGLGQIMGMNYRSAGCASVKEMVEKAGESEGNQLKQMAAFIKFNKLDDELRNLDWAGFARGYNGPGYAQNKYDVKLSDAYQSMIA